MEETLDDILCGAARLSILERHEDNLVAVKRRSIPASVFADEGTGAVVGGKIVAGGDRQPQRGDGANRRGHQIGPLRHHAGIQVLAVIAVGPAVEASVLYRRQIIRNQVRPDLIAFVGDGPELARLRLPLKPGGIANAAGEDSMRARGAVDLPDRGAFVFRSNSIFGDVAVRPDPDIELGAVRT